MADVGDQDQTHDAPTAPFRKIVLPPTDETVTFPRVQPGAASHPTPDTEPKTPQPSGPGDSGAVPDPESKTPPARRPSRPEPLPGPARQASGAEPLPGPARQASGAEPLPGPAWQGSRAEPLPEPGRQAGPQVFPGQGPPALPPFPPPAPPKSGLLSRIGDIPIRVVYLLGAILATILAVLLVFVIFPGDVPSQPESEPVVPVQPVPSAASASVPPSGGAAVAAVPAAPAKQAFAKLPGKASAVSGTITDSASGISYPRLGAPWSARSFPPFSVAQRVGKVAVPQTVIASAMLPGATEGKPSKDADYRELAVQAARWTLRTQYPKGATLAWTGSQKTPAGKGWTLGFEVTYTQAGKQREGRALVSVLEVGKTKPAMLMASIPDTGKAYWADLNTLVTKVRPL